jgi:hypothetical protein
MSEDKKIAEQMVRADAKRMLRQLRSMSTPTGVADYSSIADADIDNRTFVQLTIGVRGQLTRRNARDAAKMFREIVRRAPLAPVYPNFLGYDDDPRELWEIEEVRRYVCTWAASPRSATLKTYWRIAASGASASWPRAACRPRAWRSCCRRGRSRNERLCQQHRDRDVDRHSARRPADPDAVADVAGRGRQRRVRAWPDAAALRQGLA